MGTEIAITRIPDEVGYDCALKISPTEAALSTIHLISCRQRIWDGYYLMMRGVATKWADTTNTGEEP